jgi:lipid II:glycine glycyltransferase (peptidoglycan interpeptide bridge formation enzyme)
MTKIIAKEWNDFIAERGGDFLQSWEWGEFQELNNEKIFRLSEENAKVLLIRQNLPFGISYLYAPRGPAIKSKEELAEILNKIIGIGRKEKASFVKIEPVSPSSRIAGEELVALGLMPVERRQPESTRVIDLLKSEGNLLKDMEAETRYAIRTAEKRGVTSEKYSAAEVDEEKFREFWTIFSKTFERHELVSYPREYYLNLFRLNGEVHAELFLAKLERKTIAAAILLVFRKTAVYLHAASAVGFGRYNAPSFLLWRMMREAKTNGCENFDLWGISHTEKKWQNITYFKKRFGGQEVAYAGAWDYVLRPWPYRVFCLSRRLGGIARRLRQG